MPDRPRFTLLVVSSADGFIARAPGHAPADWASAEEQALFLAAVDAADWGIMGRTTHEAAFKPHRRRVVLSRSAPEPAWRTPSHLWLDPADMTPDDLAALVDPAHPLREGLILGGTAVHDWFAAHGRIDMVELTVEPVRFGAGLPIFFDQSDRDPMAAFEKKGFLVANERALNTGGSRLVTLRPAGSEAVRSG